MSTDETNKITTGQSIEATETTSQSEEVVTSRPAWSRRNFLKAAAIGAAAATLGSRDSAGLRLGPASALAHEDTKSSCTANDIEVLGGQIVNEPCACAPGGNFPAVAQFTVINQNNARRKCITLHLGGGGTLGGRDFLLTTDPSGDPTKGSNSIGGNGTTQVMYASLGTLNCNFGTECYPGSVIAFQTAQNQSDTPCSGPLTKYPGGQCRRQEICITGFGATLTCAGSCNVGCGGTLSMMATAVGGTAGATDQYTFSLYHPDGTLAQTLIGSSPQTFTVTNPQNGTYSLVCTDSNGCTRGATSGTVTVTTLAKPILSAGNPDCSGNVTYTVTNPDAGLTYTFAEVNCSTGVVIRTLSGNNGATTITATFPQDDADHCVVVTAGNGDPQCNQTSDPVLRHINAPVTFTLNPFVQTDCTGAGSFTAVASGGTGSFTYTFSVNGSQVQSGSSDTLSLQPQLDGQCRTVTCSVQDSNNCPGTVGAGGTDTRGISQCVTSTAC